MKQNLQMIDQLSENSISDRIRTNQINVVDDNLFPHLVGLQPKKASVLIPLTKINDLWSVLFTTRTDKVETHKGQVSFPGGAWENCDPDPTYTALRETYEEIGLQPKHIKVLGILPQRKTVSNYIVTPIVGVFSHPYSFVESQHEVKKIFFVPLNWLANSNNWTSYTYDETYNTVIKYKEFAGETIWGITAKILLDFIKTLEITY